MDHGRFAWLSALLSESAALAGLPLVHSLLFTCHLAAGSTVLMTKGIDPLPELRENALHLRAVAAPL